MKQNAQNETYITIRLHKHNNKNIYLRTYSMVQSPSWEANWFAASQEIPRISPNPKEYIIYKIKQKHTKHNNHIYNDTK